MPLFSIIVPIYNVEKYLSICIESIIKQSFKDYELILVDDGSNDKCPMICDQYAKRYSCIRVIHKHNGGLVSARKNGLSTSCGTYILNVDSDDLIPQNLLENLSDIIFNYNNPDVIAFDYQNLNESGEYTAVVENHIPEGLYDQNNTRLIKENYLYNIHLPNYYNTGSIIYSIWSKCIKRELLVRHQFNVPEIIRNGEDVAVVTPVLCDATSIYILRFVGYYYRTRENSMVHAFNPDEINNYMVLFSYILSLDLDLPKNNIIGYIFREVILQYSRAAKEKSYSEFKEYVKLTYNKQISTIVDDYHSTYLNIKSQIIVLVFKYRLWYLFWNIYH